MAIAVLGAGAFKEKQRVDILGVMAYKVAQITKAGN